MLKERIPETDHGIQGEFNVNMYDVMMRRMRDKGWITTPQILKAGITSGLALEIGPGPGYLGLEWLKKTEGTRLKGLDISPDMIKIAEKNAKEYGCEHRVEYVESDSKIMPFDDNTFDAVFTNGSLHEWAHPKDAFHEIYRVLKPSGKCCITDLRRDMNPFIKWFIKSMTKPVVMVSGLISSINAAYTRDEMYAILQDTPLRNAEVTQNLIGLCITGEKEENTQ